MTKTKKIALGGIVSALSVAVLFAAGIIPVMTISLAAAAATLVMFVSDEAGVSTGAAVYICTSAVSLLTVPDKAAVFEYVFIFGQYSLLRHFTAKLGVLKWPANLLLCNAGAAAYYFLGVFFKIFPGETFWMLAGLLVLLNITFVLYEIALVRVLAVYRMKISPYINPGGRGGRGIKRAPRNFPRKDPWKRDKKQ